MKEQKRLIGEKTLGRNTEDLRLDMIAVDLDGRRRL